MNLKLSADYSELLGVVIIKRIISAITKRTIYRLTSYALVCTSNSFLVNLTNKPNRNEPLKM